MPPGRGLGRSFGILAAACGTLIPAFLSGVQGWRMQHDWPRTNATLVSASVSGSVLPGVAEESLTYRYECFGRAFQRTQTRWVAPSRDAPTAFLLPTAVRAAPNSPISVHYDPKAPALSVFEPVLFQYGVLAAIFSRAREHPFQATRLSDPPATDAKPP